MEPLGLGYKREVQTQQKNPDQGTGYKGVTSPALCVEAQGVSELLASLSHLDWGKTGTVFGIGKHGFWQGLQVHVSLTVRNLHQFPGPKVRKDVWNAKSVAPATAGMELSGNRRLL